jgi:hypothetical protein
MLVHRNGRKKEDWNLEELAERLGELNAQDELSKDEERERERLRKRLQRRGGEFYGSEKEVEPAKRGRPKSGKNLILQHFREVEGIDNEAVLRALVPVILKIDQEPDPRLLESSASHTIEPVPVEGELLNRRELWTLLYWTHYKPSLTVSAYALQFPEDLANRRKCKTDAAYLWETLGKSPLSSRHREWRDFLPSFDPTGLTGNYTEEEVKTWLKSQVASRNPDMHPKVRNRLLMASRDSYKSSFSHVWSLTATLCCPDLRVMLCSSVDALSGAFMRKIKFYWTRESAGCGKFHALFPEFLVDEKDSGTANSFEPPNARLQRPQKSYESTSMESGAAGIRFDIALFDDPINEQTAGSETVREKTLRVFNDGFVPAGDPGSFTIVIGTPYHPKDLYTELLARNEKRVQWAVRRDPAWRAKPQVCEAKESLEHPAGNLKVNIHDLKPEDVDLLFPEQLDWDFLQEKLGTRDNQERSFRRQYLLEWVSEEESSLKLNFEMPILTKAIMMMAAIPREGETIIAVDTAHTTTNRADLTAMSVMRLFKNERGDKAVVVLEQRSDRWHRNESAYELAMLWKKWNPRLAIIEKPPYQEELELQIRLQSARYGVAMPIIWADVDNTKDAKIQRIKSLEGLLPDKLRFASGPWIDALFNQLINLNGVTRSTKKDDLADSIGLGVRYFRFPLFSDGVKEDAANAAAAEIAKKQAILKAQQDRIFGQTGLNLFEPTINMPNVEPAGPSTPLNDAVRKTLGGVFHA